MEGESLLNLEGFIAEDFAEVVSQITNSEGRVAITGIGKSAIVGQKISATLNSTGTPSFFMHAADAIHGDLGMIQKDDIVICISKSGNSPEIKALIPLIKNLNNLIVGIVGSMDSFLSNNCNYALSTYVEKEACPNNLAPTTSTTAQMAMGDAIAVAVLSCKNFGSSEFAKYHPGGSLGKKLYLKLADIAVNNSKPSVTQNASLTECILSISESRLGATVVVDGENVIGIITDGDLRRMLATNPDINTVVAQEIMTQNPKTMAENTLAVEGLSFLRGSKINHIILVDEGKYQGLVHIQDLITEGIL